MSLPLFSYGTLQQAKVQRATFGRLLEMHADALPAFELTRVPAAQTQGAGPAAAAYHANVTFTGRRDERVPGAALMLGADELHAADAYEAPASYVRALVRLASGARAWVYAHDSTARAIPRLFADATAIRDVGEGLLARTLPKTRWTHEAHLAACLWILRERPELEPERDLPAIISSYNEACGGVNDDTQGYHETITQVYVAAVRAHLAQLPADVELLEAVDALLLSERGRRDWPLRFYSRERLFSVEARRRYLAPDLAELSS